MSGLLAAALAAFCSVQAGELASPFRVEAARQPIDVEIGHAAPLVVDFDGDGARDLLVGQFGGGKLRIYRNASTNTNAATKLGAFAWFQAGGAEGKVPAG